MTRTKLVQLEISFKEQLETNIFMPLPPVFMGCLCTGGLICAVFPE